MIQLIAGEKGEGKTKSLIKMANEAVYQTKGHVVYIDDDHRHIYDLDHKIRFIETENFPIENLQEFFGFLCGIVSEDFDIDQIYIDGLLKILHVDVDGALEFLHKLKVIAEKFEIQFIICLSCNIDQIPESLREYLVA